MKRRISIVRNPGEGDVLADKSLTIKLDGLKEGTLEAGYRIVFDANDKAHTMTVSYEGEWNLELNHPIPAGKDDIILVLDCEKNNYTISEAEYRNLTIRRENGNTTLGLFVKIDGKHHPICLGLENVGDWMTVCVDTGEHILELQGHGFFGSKDVRKVSVPAGTENMEYLVSVNDDKTVMVKKKRNPAKKQQKAVKPQAEPQKQKPAPKPKQTPPAPKKPADVYGSSTTYHLKMDIKAMFRPDGGELYQWLTSGVENVFMQAMDDAVMFIGTSFANPSSPEAKGKNIFYKELNQETDELRQMAKMTGGTFLKKVHPYDLLESDEEQQTLQKILEEFIKSDQCPGITMINDEICLEPGYGIDIEDSATTSFLKGEYLKPLFGNRGILCDALMNLAEAAEYLDVAAGTLGISFNAHYPGMKKGEIKTLYTIMLEDINTDTVLQAAAQMKGVRGMGPVYTSLETETQRDEVLRIIREWVNEETVFARMKGKRIKVNPKVNQRPVHPDMNCSLTSTLLWHAMLRKFGEQSDFAEKIKKTPATCFVTAEAARLRINIMEEGTGVTETMELPYSECTAKELPESYGPLKLEDWQNRFERLDDPADQAELVDYLMYMMDIFPHIIIEGNSFRSRRPGEEVMEVEQTLTARMMANKVKQLFDLDGQFVDILRHSNMKYCQIAAYKDYLAFLFCDGKKTVATFYYDFSELVDADFLSGEDCFDHLTCGYEKDGLGYYLGREAAQLPYLKNRAGCGPLETNVVYLDQSMVPGLSESYLPSKSDAAKGYDGPYADGEPAAAGEAKAAEVLEVPEEPIASVWNVENSPTTQAVITELSQQFGAGGGLARFMKDMGLTRAELMTGSSEIVIGFWKGEVCTSRISMQYAQYAAAEEGAYQVLNEEDQKVLQECILAAVPYFNV